MKIDDVDFSSLLDHVLTKMEKLIPPEGYKTGCLGVLGVLSGFFLFKVVYKWLFNKELDDNGAR